MAGSIVDYLKKAGRDSSYQARKKLAEEYGISGYAGTAAQNTDLLSRLQSGVQNAVQQVQNTVKPEGPTANVLQGVAPANQSYTKTGNSGAFQTSDRTNSYYTNLKNLEANAPGDYERSDAVQDYQDRLQDLEGQKPGPYVSKYEAQIDSILDSILNGKEFSYTANDLANDDLYEMYRENYMKQGNQAMRDAMGNAAALTGGYGSTYAQAAGQQAYDEYLSGLNDMALEFADRAYDRYLNDRADRYNQMGVVTGLDNTDYGRYRDEVADYYSDLSYLSGRYDSEYAKDYGEYQGDVNRYYNDLNYNAGRYDSGYSQDFGEYQSNIQQEQWAQEFAQQQALAAQEQARWEAEMAFNREQFAWQKSKTSGSKGGSSGGSGASKEEARSTTLGGWAPLAASLAVKLDEKRITNSQAYETVIEEMEKGNLTEDEAYMAMLDAGIDMDKAMIEEQAEQYSLENLAQDYGLQIALGIRKKR